MRFPDYLLNLIDNRSQDKEHLNGRPMHLLLGLTPNEEHFLSYCRLYPNTRVISLCNEGATTDHLHYEADFNRVQTWRMLLEKYGRNSFSKIIFDSSTAKFLASTWKINGPLWQLVNEILIPGGVLYFDSFNTGTTSYLPNLQEPGQYQAHLGLLPLTDLKAIIYSIDLSQLRKGGYKEEELLDLGYHHDFLNRLYSCQGAFELVDQEEKPYPLKETNYSITNYLVFTKSW